MTLRAFFSAALLLAASASIGQEAPALESLFNGKDFTGWKLPEGNDAKGWWKVKDGVIVGENDPDKKGAMLYTEQAYGDAIVEAEVRWTGEVDTGLMLRKPEIQMQLGVSRSLKKDMSGSFYAGGKYPEEGRASQAEKLLKKGDWNKFRFQAKGSTFTVWINGEKAAEYTSDKFPGKGPLGLQIHANLAMKAEFRNIRAKALE